MWFRRDLRVRDLPALAQAARFERCVPAFVFDDRLLSAGRFPSAIRTQFMLGCLSELDEALRGRGGRLVVRRGRPEEEIPKLAEEAGARDVFFTADVNPWATRRDQRVIDALAERHVRAHPMPGGSVVDDPSEVLTKQGTPYSVFSPYARAWKQVPRRDQLQAPREITLPSEVEAGTLPKITELGLEEPSTEGSFTPGEEAARKQLDAFLRQGLAKYDDLRDNPAQGSSRLSPYVRWGCVSPLVIDNRVADVGSDSAETFRDELAWRDFYGAVLMHFPDTVRLEFQERMRELWWAEPGDELTAWREGRTGFPLVDAGMRQLHAEGWMQNRVRMVVGSFLTKDLHLDWRHGEKVFMDLLIDGDMAANNGGWQWIASTGADPKPYFQRLFNPMTQQEKFDPKGEYVRRWVPELKDVPDKKLSKPWTMSEEEQEAAGCRIGDGGDYPAPIIDHAHERKRAIERYQAVGSG